MAQWGHEAVGLGKDTERKGRGKKFQLEEDTKNAVFFLHNATVGRPFLLKFT